MIHVLTNAASIRDELSRMKPTKVAVAYVGAGWERYVDENCLREIVVSPTVGSNPSAIRGIMLKLRHENVYLLDHLHAKVYFSENDVLVGSCNLSNNGLGDDGLEEVAIAIRQTDVVTELRNLFESYKRMANELYPDEASKIDRLRKLQIEVDKRFSGGVGEASGASPSIKDYCGVHTINFVWYDYGGPDMVLNDEQLAQAVAEDDVEAPERNFEEYFNDFASLAPRDTIEKYTWILSWGCNNDGSPRQNGAIDWIYITHLVQDGITENGGYTKFAGQAKNSLIPPVPFILNAETKQKIRNLLNQPDFEPLRWSQQDEQLWVTNGKRELVSQLIEQLKRTFNHDRQTPG